MQASAYLKYVGDITVYFNKAGKVVSWEGAPIFLDTDIIQGSFSILYIYALINWKKTIS